MSEFHNDRQLQEEGNLEEASAAYHRKLELNSDEPWTHHHMGETLAKLNRWDEAVTAYRHAIELKPDFCWSYHHLGDALAQQQQWEESATAFRRALELNPEHFGTYVGLGNSLAKLGQLDEAIAAYRRASELNPDADWIHSALANALQQRNQSALAEAIASYRHIIELYPDNVEAFHNLLQILPDNWEVGLQLGNILVEQGRLDEAIATYRRALELNPQAYECHHQLGEAIYQRVMENPETFFSQYNLAKNPHKDYQLFDPELPFVCFLNDQAFLEATAHLDDATYTVEWYRVYLRRFLSEAEKQGCINWLQTPGHSRELGLKVWRETLAEFQTLLKISFTIVGLEEAVKCYHRALELSPNHHSSYYRLAEVFTEQGKHEQALVLYHQLSLKLAEEGKIVEAVACFQQATHPPLHEGKMYEMLWRKLNQLAPLEASDSYYPTDLQPEAIEQYFRETSQYTIMNLSSLTEEDKALLEKNGFLLTNLQLIAQDNLTLEEIYINYFAEGKNSRLSQQLPKQNNYQFIYQSHLNQQNIYQQSIVETGYIYSVCPLSGQVIRSEQSFYDVAWLPMMSYRFVGCEIYYLIVGHFWGPKMFIYFPRLELIIHLNPFVQGSEQAIINRLKGYMVSCWQDSLKYISKPQKKGVVAILGLLTNIGHYFWNEVTGLQFLSDNGLLDKLDKILIEPNEYFNVADAFPEIADKIIRISDKKSMFKAIIENNYLAVRVDNVFVRETLTTRIYEGSLKRCSPQLLAEVEGAKNKHFPLLWFGIRSHDKSWVSQVEGIVNIIKSLAVDFPGLGVVFDGWSRIEREDERGELMIAKDQATEQEILEILPPDIQAYSTIGSMSYEKVVWAYAIDLYVIPLSSGSTAVSWIANKPGVMHANSSINTEPLREQVTYSRENVVPPVFVPVECIVDQQASPYILSVACQNYDFDWRIVYNETLKIINSLNPNRA
ncbi:tetratricopeptide repeat protein [Microcoleus sp. AT3-D2]|uniref:tetratricopeptide repeat protein n=1 Tax=Microcoleus sp. AT3-D2 TaxID=2818612 RepID=UPI002FCFE4EC